MLSAAVTTTAGLFLQICKEINKVANILADFIQDRAGQCAEDLLICRKASERRVCVFTDQFLSYGDIGVDIGITTAPVINANYVESYHKVNSTC